MNLLHSFPPNRIMLKLQPLLSEYLLENASLPLQDAGHLIIRRETAVVKDEDNAILPPQTSLVFSSEEPTPAEQQNLIGFLSKRLSISAQQATELVSKEGNLQNAFAENESIDWASFGNFQKQQDGLISFFEADALNNYLPVISLKQTQQQPQKETTEEVIEEAAEPTIMSEPLNELEEPIQKDYWWVWAIVILVVSLVLILFRFL